MVSTAADPTTEFETVIGLEVHAQLSTQSKMFCGCSAAAFISPPNTNTCPICGGMPGVLPVINAEAVRQAIRVALALHGTVQRASKFDRKNYTYPDLPKGYQISQYDLPLSTGGYVDLATEAGDKRIGITRVHMEEDTGRSMHRTHVDGTGYSLVDLNRAGVPLLEIVSEPDLRSPEEAQLYLRTLRDLLRYIGASTGNMEEGALRCDANVSLRRHGETAFGAKVEIKNVNSLRGLLMAIRYEVERQAATIRADGTLIQETRGWSEPQGVTLAQRTKEYADDYRYFPEPDLPTLVLTDEFIEEARASLPELPEERRARYLTVYRLSPDDARILTESPGMGDYFEAIIGADAPSERVRVANAIVINDLRTLLREQDLPLARAPRPEAMRALINLIERGVISRAVARDVIAEMIASGEDAESIVTRRGLAQQNDEAALRKYIEQAITANPKAVADYRGGKEPALNAIVGAVMKASKGTANNQVVRELLKQRLAAPS